MKRGISILFFILFLTNCLLAQKLSIAISTNKVEINEPFQIQFLFNGNGSNLKLPSLNDFNILEGPNQEMVTDLISGTRSASISFILSAKKEGKFIIGPASVLAGGKNIQSNSVSLLVSKGKTNTTPQNTSPNPQNITAPTSQNINENIFLRAVVNKSNVYHGEVFHATFKIYTRIGVQRWGNLNGGCNGFFVQKVNTSIKANQTQETINGITYLVIDVHKLFLTPQQTGKLTVDPMEMECIIVQKTNRRPRNIQEFMSGGYEEVLVKLKSLPVSIDVQALPGEGKPESFSGAVGNYSYKSVLSKDNIKANDAVNLTLTLSGNGNIKLVEPPKVNLPEDFEVYDAKTTENISVTENGIDGTKTFDYLFIPRHEGDYKIEPVTFSYFDPYKKEYVVLPSPGFDLHVAKGDGTAATVVGGTNAKEDIKVLGNDIRYIKTSTILKEKEELFFGSTLFYFSLISPLLCFIAFIFIRRKNIADNKDGVAVKSRKATKMARKRLSIAEQHLKSNDKELFYIEIYKALNGYISDKLNIPVADLNKEHISSTLTNRNVSVTTIEKLITTIDNCEFARYAPSSVSGDLNGIYNSTVELITKIEDEIV